MKAFLNQQLREKDERVVALLQDLERGKNDQEIISEWQNIAKMSEEIVYRI